MRRETFTCDACGAFRGPSNHWFLFASSKSYKSFTVFEFVSEMRDVEHICGRECLNRRIEKWLSESK